jgi:hypothetical protein|tara:strand:- start:994 stop:1554 length:561 start_codon:yes stop_codon:yes gene_type:complete
MDDLSNPLDLLATNMCSPMVVYIVFVVVTAIALFMTRSALKRYNTEKMETLFNIHLMNEIKMVIVIGAVMYGLCQYNQVNLAWVFLIFPIIYVLLKNILIFIPVSSANQNAPVPQTFNQDEMFKQMNQANMQQKVIQQQQQQVANKGIMDTPVNKDIGGFGGGLSPPLNSGLSGNDAMMNGNMMGF